MEVDEDSPWVGPPESFSQDIPLEVPRGVDEYQVRSEPYDMSQLPVRPRLSKRRTASEIQQGTFKNPRDLLENLKRGYSNDGMIWMDHSKPYSQANNTLYILLSVKGVSTAHASLRVFSKVISIGAFAVGTALFASATLITIMEALVTAAIILCAGIFGRVTVSFLTQ